MKFAAVIGTGGDKSCEIERVREGVYRIDGREVVVDSLRVDDGLYSILLEGKSYEVFVREERKGYSVDIGGHTIPVRLQDPFSGKAGKGGNDIEGEAVVQSPMPGRVVNLKVTEGQQVAEGEGVVVVEAMKMENELASPKTGKVRKISVKVGDAVEAGQDLIVIE